MTAAQLIELLSHVPPGTPVLVPRSDHAYEDARARCELLEHCRSDGRHYDPDRRCRAMVQTVVIR